MVGAGGVDSSDVVSNGLDGVPSVWGPSEPTAVPSVWGPSEPTAVPSVRGLSEPTVVPSVAMAESVVGASPKKKK